MDFLISSAHAQAAGAPAAGGGISTLVMMGVMIAFFYFMLIRPQMKRAKEQRTMLAALAKGDEVATTTGMLGTIVEISETYTSVEVAPNVVVKLQKQAITAVLPKGTLKSA
ncbi:protein translocase subunit yajC /protein translocase subunit secM [Tahibacter aquaticus]|uniref:Sec translocon accessory complex subunit YajC n=1 Tax=Tahibacter aquaticus TaxID=520092 RepID=A0A4R6Z9D6_9GAMM|nr:preprotein translocase subunit YajC [Tahibacter aquaticus]TDR48510.1 protein translocase subunit yajC /protein translocase subunit secM [Tahibacter aquaticus]